MGRYRNLFTAIALIMPLLAIDCGGPSPEVVTRSFLDAMKNDQWAEAARFVDSSNLPASMSTLQNQAASTSEKDSDSERLAKLLFSRISYNLGSTKVEGDSATVKVQIKAVDLRRIIAKYISDILPLALASAFSGGKAELAPKVNKYVEDAVADPQAPMSTTDIDVKLGRTQGQWRISANDELFNAMTGDLADMAKAIQAVSTPASGVSPAPSVGSAVQIPTITPQLATKLTATITPQPTAKPTPAAGFSRSRSAILGAGIRALYKEKEGDRAVVINVREIVRGTEAWSRIKASNSFNDAPYPGYEYILAKVQFKYESGPADLVYDLDDRLFAAVSAQGKVYDMPSLVLPRPSIETKLYPGASHEGWAAFMVANDDSAPVMVFGLSRDGSGGLWFKLYAE